MTKASPGTFLASGLLCVALSISSLATAQPIASLAPEIQVAIGTPGFDFPYSMATAADGDILVAGTADSAGGRRSSPAYGGEDFVLWRLDKNLAVRWDQSFGGNANDRMFDIAEDSKGNILVVGRSLSPVSGNKSAAGLGGNDYWAVLTDRNGQKLWERTFGGDGDDRCFGVLRLPTDDFVLVGSSASLPNTVAGGKRLPNYGGADVYAVCIGNNGVQKWEACFGGAADDTCRSAVLLANGTIVLVGYSYSAPGGWANKTTALVGFVDIWCIGIDVNGRQLWQSGHGKADQYLSADTRGATATPDGGFLVATSRTNPAGDPADPATVWQSEGLLLKFDAAGKLQSTRHYPNPSAGRNPSQEALNGVHFGRVMRLQGGGYLVGGLTDSAAGGFQLEPTHGMNDVVVLQLDDSLEPVASAVLGGTSNEWGPALSQLPDGHLCVALQSYSGVGGNKTVPAYGSLDSWLLTMSPYVQDSIRIFAAVELQFKTQLGQRYQLAHSSDLTSWVPQGPVFAGTGTTTTNLVSILGTQARYWKLLRL